MSYRGFKRWKSDTYTHTYIRTPAKNHISRCFNYCEYSDTNISKKNFSEEAKKVIIYITILFNAIVRTSHIPSQWKVAQIIMISKSGKPPNGVTSYWPISLLPIMTKLFEKLLLVRLKTPVSEDKLIPDHWFGFRNNHSTKEQVNKV